MTVPAALLPDPHGSSPTTVALAGDWHGETAYAVSAIEFALAGGAEAIVHLGDFGYLFRPQFLAALDAALGEAPLYFIDGNHEDFDWLHSLPLDHRGVRPVSRRISHLPRGFRWSWSGQRWLALGGAHSVDRSRRIPGSTWWPQEALQEREIASAAADGPVEVLISHNSPAAIPVPHTYAAGTFPVEDEAADDAQRELVQRVVDATAPRLIAHGHFHQHYRDRLGGTTVLGLSHDRAPLSGNIAFLDTSTLRFLPPTAPAPALAELPAFS